MLSVAIDKANALIVKALHAPDAGKAFDTANTNTLPAYGPERAPARDITFFCVLKAGKKYSAEHVARLKAAVERNTSFPFRFVCLSDVPVPCERIELKHDWPGFWSKVELFRPGVANPEHLNVYVDLDVLITGKLDRFLAYPHRFSMTRDDGYPERANSSVMAWSGDHSYIYEEMAENPTLNRMRFIAAPWFGDQALVESELIKKGQPADRIDDLFNNSSKTYRRLVDKEDIHPQTMFLSFQGLGSKPGAKALNGNPLIQEHWNLG